MAEFESSFMVGDIVTCNQTEYGRLKVAKILADTVLHLRPLKTPRKLVITIDMFVELVRRPKRT